MKTTHDTLLGGAVQIEQPEHGFRAGTDSILLAASLPCAEMAMELGCGPGGALLPAAFRCPAMRVTGVEIDPDVAALARRNIAVNGWQGRCEALVGDAGAVNPAWENRFDLVFSNPPYFTPGQTSAPGAGRAAAYVQSVPLDTWIARMVFAARPKGALVIIHRAAELAGLLAGLGRRAGEITVLPIRPRAGTEAKRVLVKARKGLRPGPVRLLDGLELDDTARMDAIMAGGALDWH